MATETTFRVEEFADELAAAPTNYDVATTLVFAVALADTPEIDYSVN